MFTIGSKALNYWNIFPTREGMSDIDYLTTFKLYDKWLDINKKDIVHIEKNKHGYTVFKKNSVPLEFRIDQELYDLVNKNKLHKDGNVLPSVVLAMKLTHRYRKNSRHFWKTLRDIHYLRLLNISVPGSLSQWVIEEEKRILNYSHPNLNTSKEDFFVDEYKYDHDSIHLAMALYDKPAYEYYKNPKNPVLCSKKLFFEVEEDIRLAGCLEETLVLALERHQIPNDFKPDPFLSFKIAYSKVCTSITSGFFREYAYDNYHKILYLYTQKRSNYVELFKEKVTEGVVKLCIR